ncbi:hypothetical protein [Psychromicrobium xiongbiense]|uniref:hypothetical protein n=1 Tax=Psychromicrobium xiongbiense TaxID=3051184 RepID=UPI002556F050|nr:hypothetical protein [Psychromicrobium sp. YIM S02556]
MPDAWFYLSLVIGGASFLLCLGYAVAKKAPNDVTILAAAAVELYLLVFVVASIVRASIGERIAGDPWEFWGYAATAVVIPIGAVYWSLMERTRWSNIVLAAVGLIGIVMMFRMEQIWYGFGGVILR